MEWAVLDACGVGLEERKSVHKMIVHCKNCGKAYYTERNSIVEKIVYRDGEVFCQCGDKMFNREKPIFRVGFMMNSLSGWIKEAGSTDISEYTKARETAHSFLKLKFSGCKIYIIAKGQGNTAGALKKILYENKIVFDDVVMKADRLMSDIVNSLGLDIFCNDRMEYANDLFSNCPGTKIITLKEHGSFINEWKKHTGSSGIAFSDYCSRKGKDRGKPVGCQTCAKMWDCPSDNIVAACFGQECGLYRKIV